MRRDDERSGSKRGAVSKGSLSSHLPWSELLSLLLSALLSVQEFDCSLSSLMSDVLLCFFLAGALVVVVGEGLGEKWNRGM